MKSLSPLYRWQLRRTPGRHLGLLLLAPVILFTLAACGPSDGLTREDAQAIRAQIEQVANRLDTVERRLTDLSEAQPPAMLISQVQGVRADLSQARELLTDVSQQLAPASENDIDDTEPLPGGFDGSPSLPQGGLEDGLPR